MGIAARLAPALKPVLLEASCLGSQHEVRSPLAIEDTACVVHCRCEALAAVGKTVANSEAQLRACEFLLAKQCPDGGWGESYLSCQDKVQPQPRPPSRHACK